MDKLKAPSVETMQVIRVKDVRGCGVRFCQEPHEHDPIRIVEFYFTTDGLLLAVNDPNLETSHA